MHIEIWKNRYRSFSRPAEDDTGAPASRLLYSASFRYRKKKPHGALVYLRTAEGNDALAWVDKDGNSVTESQFEILKAAECEPDTPALPRQDNHHELVRKAVELIVAEEKSVGGQLGRPSGARFRTYERLKRYADDVKGTLFDSAELGKAIEEISPVSHCASLLRTRSIANSAPASRMTSLQNW